MGWEYAITIQSNSYKEVVDALYNSFFSFSTNYTVAKDSTGFIISDTKRDWSEIMMISIDIADEYTYNVAQGEEYIYCLFYVGGVEAKHLKNNLEATLDKTNCVYMISDL